jgi:biopolymer transport protein ExbB/TolQ
MSDAAAAVVCPRCQGRNTHPAQIDAYIVDCVHCDRSFATRSPLDDPAADPRQPVSRIATEASSTLGPTDVPFLSSGLAGAALTAAFYLMIVYPLRGTYFADLFSDRGWVPYAVALMAGWSAVILAHKYRLLREQEAVLADELLASEFGDDIGPDTTAGPLRHLEARSERSPRSFVVTRLIRALRHFRAHGSIRDVVDQLGQQAHSDSGTVDASYTLVRTFIWAIPILGFIGTVLGIGSSVSGFSDSVLGAADLGVMKQSIGAVTTGLGVAFDTTLLALVVSILVMFPASWLQKAERGFLSRVEEYCDEHLIRRLVQPAVGSEGADSDQLGSSVRELQGEFERLAKTIGELDGRLDRMGRA